MTFQKHDDGVALPAFNVDTTSMPDGVDRRAFLMRSAVAGAVAVISGCSDGQTQAAASAPPPTRPPLPSTPLADRLNVVQKAKGPVMTTVDEFYKVGPGRSSSHTIGSRRITYDFYQRCTKLPADQLSNATARKVHLFGTLSATAKGHGTERAALAGIIGKEPATFDPLFLDELRDKPDQVFTVTLGGVDLDTAVTATALTAKQMHSKYKETSQGGLAVSLVLC
jgi:L-serine dehydratase